MMIMIINITIVPPITPPVIAVVVVSSQLLPPVSKTNSTQVATYI